MHTETLEPRRLYSAGLDPTFADAGRLAFTAAFEPTVNVASLESGGGGSLFVGGTTADGRPAVAKYDDAGRLIASFGQGGYAVVPFDVDRLAYDPAHGTLYVVGNDTLSNLQDLTRSTSVARLRANGKLDRTFANNGTFEVLAKRPRGGGTFASVSTETINPLPDGSVLLGVDRATRWRTGSADQDLVLVKLTPGGAYDTQYGTNGVVQVVSGYFQRNYGLGMDVSHFTRGYRGVFADVQTDGNVARVAVNYVDGYRPDREDTPNAKLPSFGTFSVLSRTVTAAGKLSRGQSAAWEVADTTAQKTGASFIYTGFDGRTVRAVLDGGDYPTDRRLTQYTYSLKPGQKPDRQSFSVAESDTFIVAIERSGNGTYTAADFHKHVFRLRSDFTTDPAFGDHGVATPTNLDVINDGPFLYADDRGRVLGFQYTVGQYGVYSLLRMD